MFKKIIPLASALLWLGLVCSCAKNNESGSTPLDPDLSIEGGTCEDNNNCGDGLVCEEGICKKNEAGASLSEEIKGIATGWAHACDINQSGLLFCWGDNSHGQLGIGNTVAQTSAQPVGSDKWLTVTAGDDFTCGIKEVDSKLYCWGNNIVGQLGLGDSSEREYSTPQLVGNEKWKSISGGAQHACGITDGDQLYCWGQNDLGQIGAGVKQTPLPLPQAVGADKWKVVSAGDTRTCGIKDDNVIYCWGINSFNELGVGGDNCGVHMWTYSPLPVRGSECTCQSVAGGVSCLPQTDYAKWISVSTGQDYTCGISMDDHKLYCWGQDRYGNLGIGEHKDEVFTNHPHVVGDDKWASVDVSSYHACGIKEDDGKLYCWGRNNKGQLGIGNMIDQNTPQAVGSDKWKSVSSGSLYTCGIREVDGKIYCW